MDFSFTEEQTLLRNSVQKLIQNSYDFETRRKVAKSDAGWRKEIWQQIANDGLLGAAIPEDFGGLGGGAVETMIVMEEFGRGLVIEPYLQNAVVAAGFLKAGGSTKQKEELHPGDHRAARTSMPFAYAEPQGRYNLADLTTKATKSGSGLHTQRLQGRRAGCAVGRQTHRHRTHLGRSARRQGRLGLHGRQECQGRHHP
jgi:alkylation response protein AidB-like acyl-CoA dehydrogenase